MTRFLYLDNGNQKANIQSVGMPWNYAPRTPSLIKCATMCMQFQFILKRNQPPICAPIPDMRNHYTWRGGRCGRDTLMAQTVTQLEQPFFDVSGTNTWWWEWCWRWCHKPAAVMWCHKLRTHFSRSSSSLPAAGPCDVLELSVFRFRFALFPQKSVGGCRRQSAISINKD